MGQRVKGRRLWIKLYPVDCLDGSIRYQLEPDERGVWYDLLNFSAICANPGTIADKDGRPYPHNFIANRLNISLDLLELALKKCKEEGRIKEVDGGIIEITNWNAYQSEYQRQKPYRQKEASKKGRGQFLNVFLEDDEYQKLIEKFGETGAAERIENLSVGIESKGYKYKSHYATILSWSRSDRKERGNGKGGGYTQASAAKPRTSGGAPIGGEQGRREHIERLKASVGAPLR